MGVNITIVAVVMNTTSNEQVMVIIIHNNPGTIMVHSQTLEYNYQQKYSKSYFPIVIPIIIPSAFTSDIIMYGSPIEEVELVSQLA